jgi:hypothetical protein
MISWIIFERFFPLGARVQEVDDEDEEKVDDDDEDDDEEEDIPEEAKISRMDC